MAGRAAQRGTVRLTLVRRFLAGALVCILTPLAAHAQEPTAAVTDARRLMAEGRFADAVPAWRAILRTDSTDSTIWNSLAAALHRLERYDEAAIAVERAVALNPNSAGARFNRALTYSELGDVQGAVDELNAAIAIRADVAPLFTERGAAYALLGRNAEAHVDWERSLELDSTYIWPHFYRALAAITDARYADAARDLDIVLARETLLSAHLWRWLAYSLDGRAAPELPAADTAWPAPIADFLRGALPESELLAAAQQQRIANDDRRLASALHYIGQKHVASGAFTEACRAFERIATLTAPRHAEVVAAEAQLRRIRQRCVD